MTKLPNVAYFKFQRSSLSVLRFNFIQDVTALTLKMKCSYIKCTHVWTDTMGMYQSDLQSSHQITIGITAVHDVLSQIIFLKQRSSFWLLLDNYQQGGTFEGRYSKEKQRRQPFLMRKFNKVKHIACCHVWYIDSPFNFLFMFIFN